MNANAKKVASLKREEITHAEIVVTNSVKARWLNYIGGECVETEHEFVVGESVSLGSWRPEGMMSTLGDGTEIFLFWEYLEKMTEDTNTEAEDEDGDKFTKDELYAKVREAFRNFYAVRVGTMTEDSQMLVDILDAIEDDLREKMSECKLCDDLANEYNDRADLLELIGNDPERCFDAGRFAYAFNPFYQDNKSDNFSDSAEYIALDGYANLCSIRDRAYLACWYDGNISDYFGGNYGEPDEDALQELAEVFGGDYDNGEADDDENGEEVR